MIYIGQYSTQKLEGVFTKLERGIVLDHSLHVAIVVPRKVFRRFVAFAEDIHAGFLFELVSHW